MGWIEAVKDFSSTAILVMVATQAVLGSRLSPAARKRLDTYIWRPLGFVVLISISAAAIARHEWWLVGTLAAGLVLLLLLKLWSMRERRTPETPPGS